MEANSKLLKKLELGQCMHTNPKTRRLEKAVCDQSKSLKIHSKSALTMKGDYGLLFCGMNVRDSGPNI